MNVRLFAALLLFLLFLGACQDTRTTAGSVDALQEACLSSCDGTPEQAHLTMRPDATLYTTDEAVCIRDSKNRLYCGTCRCDEAILQPHANVTSGAEPLDVVCTFSKEEGRILMSCS